MAEIKQTQAPPQRIDMSQSALAKPAKNMAQIQALFAERSVMSRIQAVIPKHLTPERLLKVIVSSISKTPKLLECTQLSLLQAAIAMSELGLEPDAVRGLAYLVPYKTQCQLIIGYRGYIELARRSGTLKQVEARVAREKDKLDIRFGLEPKLEHVPCLDADPGAPRLVYAIARFSDGSFHVEVMSMSEVEAIRKRSRAANGGPWVTDYEEMAKKTVMRRLAKWLPLSPELAKAIELDDEQFVESTGRALQAAPALPATTAVETLDLGGDVVDAETGVVLEEAGAPVVAIDALPPELTEEEKALAAQLAELLEAIAKADSKADVRGLLARIKALPMPERGTASAAYEERIKALVGGEA